MKTFRIFQFPIGLCFLALAGSLLAHNVAGNDAAFLEQSSGAQIPIFIYLGAKHMVTGYDHLLFLLSVIFFLYHLRDVAAYVTLFAIGHSITLLSGVLAGWHFDPYAIDAIIGLSVVYKAFDNLGGFEKLFGLRPNTKAAVLIFGLFHGLGLSTKLQELSLSKDWLVGNMISFNIGVEVGQLFALSIILVFMTWWRSSQSFNKRAVLANVVLMASGFLLMTYQLGGYYAEKRDAQLDAVVLSVQANGDVQ